MSSDFEPFTVSGNRNVNEVDRDEIHEEGDWKGEA
jgi:hypothetical protein